MAAEAADLKRLWAPWRNAFLAKPFKGRCIFCAARSTRDARQQLVVMRSTRALVMLNLYPYNNGHVMIAPRRHVGDLEQLTPAEWAEMGRLSQRMMQRLRKLLRPHGFNLGLNQGRVAGAGFPGHLHLHIVPRWNGDTNFMPAIGRTKVISQSLDELYRLLRR